MHGPAIFYKTKTLREDAHDVLRKAVMQLHIGAGSGASPSRIEGFRKFEGDLSALL